MRSLASRSLGRSSVWKVPQDSRAALQALIDAGAGGTVVIPPGEYWIDASLVMTDEHNGTKVDFSNATVLASPVFFALSPQGSDGTLQKLLVIYGGDANAGSAGSANSGSSSAATALPQGRDIGAGASEGATSITVAGSGSAIPTAPFDAMILEGDQASNGEYNIREIVRVTEVDGTTLTLSTGLKRAFSEDSLVKWRADGADFAHDIEIVNLRTRGHDPLRGGYLDYADIDANVTINVSFQNIVTGDNHGWAASFQANKNLRIDGWTYGENLNTAEAGGVGYGIAVYGGDGHVLRYITSDTTYRRGGIHLSGCHDVDIHGYYGGVGESNESKNNINSLDLHGKGEYDIRITASYSGSRLNIGAHFRGCTKVRVSDSAFARQITIAPGADDVELTDVIGSTLDAVRRTDLSGYDPDGSTEGIGHTVGIHLTRVTLTSHNYNFPLLLHEVGIFTATDCAFTYGHEVFFGSTVNKIPAAVIECIETDGAVSVGGNQQGWPLRYGGAMYTGSALGSGTDNDPVLYGVGGTYTFLRCSFDNSLGDGTYPPVMMGSQVGAKTQDLPTVLFLSCTFAGKTERAIWIRGACTGGSVTATDCAYARTGGEPTGLIDDQSGNVTPVESGTDLEEAAV